MTEEQIPELTVADHMALATVDLHGRPNMSEGDVVRLVGQAGIRWSHLTLTPAELLARRTLH